MSHDHDVLLDPLCHTIVWSINLAQDRLESDKDPKLLKETIHLLATGIGSMLDLINPEALEKVRQSVNRTIDEAMQNASRPPTVGSC